MKKAILIGVLILGVILISGCAKNTGVLVMQITDQPKLNIEKALITISNVGVHLAGPDEEENTTTMAGWFTVVSEAKTFDLVAIKDIKEFLGSAELTAGKYTQIRLNMDKALVTIDGIEYDLAIPSKTAKLIKPFDIEVNKTTTLTLDFDAEKSVVERGKTGKYNLKPTIKIETL